MAAPGMFAGLTDDVKLTTPASSVWANKAPLKAPKIRRGSPPLFPMCPCGLAEKQHRCPAYLTEYIVVVKATVDTVLHKIYHVVAVSGDDAATRVPLSENEKIMDVRSMKKDDSGVTLLTVAL